MNKVFGNKATPEIQPGVATSPEPGAARNTIVYPPYSHSREVSCG